MSELFATRKNNYNLRNFQKLESSLVRTVKVRTETVSYRRTSNMEPDSGKIKDIGNKFKKEMKNWKCDECPSRICKMYIQRVGFIN